MTARLPLLGAPLAAPVPTVRCVCTSGRFGIHYSEEKGCTVYHSLPYCPAFERIETLYDVMRHAELCDIAFSPS